MSLPANSAGQPASALVHAGTTAATGVYYLTFYTSGSGPLQPLGSTSTLLVYQEVAMRAHVTNPAQGLKATFEHCSRGGTGVPAAECETGHGG